MPYGRAAPDEQTMNTHQSVQNDANQQSSGKLDQISSKDRRSQIQSRKDNGTINDQQSVTDNITERRHGNFQGSRDQSEIDTKEPLKYNAFNVVSNLFGSNSQKSPKQAAVVKR